MRHANHSYGRIEIAQKANFGYPVNWADPPMKISKTRSRLEMLTLFGGSALLLLAGILVALQFVQPAPPSLIRIATGSDEGAYSFYAEQYRRLLAEHGIRLEIVETAGSVENLERLLASSEPDAADSERIDLAFIQGGIATAEQKARLSGLGSMSYEPLWLLARAPTDGDRSTRVPPAKTELDEGTMLRMLIEPDRTPQLNQLAGARIGIGAEDSGTRSLALHLLRANGISEDDGTLVTQGLEDSIEALTNGDLDLVFVVGATDSPRLRALTQQDDILLQDLPRAAAYAQRDRFLTVLKLPRGTLDPAADVPATDLDLVATTANLVATPDIHPALVDLLLAAAAEVHGQGSLFAAPGTFPTAEHSDFPLNTDAERHYKYGPPLLQRFLPFWLATWVDRTKVMLLPLVVLLIPLVKTLPPAYRWRVRRRILRWYKDLRRIDLELLETPPPSQRRLTELAREIETIESDAARVDVPLSYSDALYHLRLHIALLTDKIERLAARAATQES